MRLPFGVRPTSAVAVAVAVAAVVVAMVLAAGSGPPPSERLASAAQRTASSSFAYAARIEGDTAALDELRPGVGGLLSGLLITGRRVDGSAELLVAVAGLEVLQVRTLPDGDVFLRLGAAGVGAIGSAFAEGAVARLEEAQVPPDVVAAVDEALAGEWVGLEGEPADAPPSDPGLLGDVLGGDLAGFVERYVTVGEVTGGEDGEVFTLHVDTRALLDAIRDAVPGGALDLEQELPNLPDTVRGSATVAEDVVTRLAFDLPPTLGEAEGLLARLVVELSDHGEVEALAAPAEAVIIASQDLLEAAALLAGPVAGEPLPGPGSPPGTPTGGQ